MPRTPSNGLTFEKLRELARAGAEDALKRLRAEIGGWRPTTGDGGAHETDRCGGRDRLPKVGEAAWLGRRFTPEVAGRR